MRKLFHSLSRHIVPGRRFSAPEGKRLYAVGDIHGRLDLLDDLLVQIEYDLHERPIKAATLIFLGDLIDRGPNSAGVVERLRGLTHFPARMMFLLGNHEELLLRVLAAEPGLAYDWLDFGGDACVASYNISASSLRAMDERRIAEVLGAAIPTTHISFLKSFGDTFRFGDYLVVHAGIRPGITLEDQQPHDLRWIRQPFLADAHDHGYMVIHGHTISDGVERRPNRVGIDTGAHRTGVLTAAVIEGADIRFLATDANRRAS